MRRFAPALICLAISVICAWCGLAAVVDSGAPATAPEPGVARGETPPPTAMAELERQDLQAEEAEGNDRPRTLGFDQTVDRLVTLGVSMWEALQRDDHDAVEAANAEAEALLVAITNTCPDAGERALDRRTRVPPDNADLRVEVRRHVLERILRDALASRHALVERNLGRASLDGIVHAMLATLPLEAGLAQRLGKGLLVDQPYLGPSHEPVVLDLCALATEHPFLVDVVAGLLRTLWHNLEATGARSSERLTSLALLFLDDGNEARRLAAIRELVLDPEFRDLVVEHVLRANNPDLVNDVAQVACTELEPIDALEVLGRIQGVGGEELLGAFVVLGTRDPGMLANEYERVLADGIRANLRAQLVTGACARRDPEALEVARVAFDIDPDPEVRMRALFALSSHPQPAVAEAALTAALDDPRQGEDPDWIAGVALALQNLASSGATNAIDRLGRRLERHPLLDDATRRSVRALLAEHVPGRR